MCLFIDKKDWFVAKKDITCYKVLEGNEKDGYRTPCQGWPVKPGTTLIPDESSPVIEENGFKYELGAGVIHAYTGIVEVSGSHIFKAIIPEGTKFWIQSDLTEVAAEKLILTTEELTSGKCLPDLKDHLTPKLKVYTSAGEITEVGKISGSDILGVVTSGGKIVGVEVSERMYFSESNPKYSGKTYDKPFEDMDGLGNCAEIKEKSTGKLLAIEWAKSKGGYLPSSGELKEAFMELFEINSVLVMVGKKPIMSDRYFWTSSMKSSESIWICSSSGGYYWDNWCYCSWNTAAVFFLSYPALLKNKMQEKGAKSLNDGAKKLTA
ncbi:MAG: hypothetical protein J6I84_03810 [Bacilli bacterium]|nr:hypothetical protein [Bacilli bacterium]